VLLVGTHAAMLHGEAEASFSSAAPNRGHCTRRGREVDDDGVATESTA
jgi:hypothetical protein